MTVSVLTSALPAREPMLDEAIRSVKDQTRTDVEHLYAFDHEHRGAGPILNALLEEAMGDWVMVLDDDDLLDPNHIETVLANIEDADVVYTLPRVEGAYVFRQYEHPFDGAVLHQMNIVSHTALMRTELVRAVGGWTASRQFDWDLFKRLHLEGARFRQVQEVTWTYRLHGSNWSHGTLEVPA